MSLLRNIATGLRSLFGKERIKREWDEELRGYLEMAVEEKMNQGLSRKEALRVVRLEQGTVEVAKEVVRSASWESVVETCWQDLRFAVRALRKSRTFTAVSVLTLALGIGANTAIFSMVDALVLRPLPVPNPEQILILGLQQGNGGVGSQFSVPEYRDIATQTSSSFSGVFGYWFGIDGLSVGAGADRIATNYVTGNFFSTLGIKPLLGRFVAPGEGESPNSDPVIVLSYDYWRKRFGSDPSVVGSKVFVDGRPVTVIGVAPKNFYGISAVLNIQAYLPLSMLTLEGEPPDFMQNRTLRSMFVAARLLPDQTLSQASAALAVVADRMTQQFPAAEKDTGLMAFPELQARPNPDPNKTMLVISSLFLSLVIIILLLACLNVANISLVRATVREGEMAIRAALGASRGRLVRQLLTESVLLSVLGGVVGVVMGRWVSYLLSTLDLHSELPVHLDFGLDWRVFTYAMLVTMATGVVVGLLPAIRASRADVNSLLHQVARSLLGGKHGLRSSLVVVQVAGSLTLLVIAGLFVRSLKVAERSDLGFDANQVADVSMDPGEIGYNEAQGLAFYKSLLDRVRSLPGVESAGLTSSIPLSYYNDADSLTIEGQQSGPGRRPPRAMFSVITPGYLETMKIPLVKGRTFTEADDADSGFVAIINQDMAQRYWPNQDPLGHHFTIGRDSKHIMEVIGVARNWRVAGVTGNIVPSFLVPLQQHYSSGLTSLQTLVVRVNGDAATEVLELERLVQRLEPTLPVFDAQPMVRAIDTLNGLLIFQLGAVLVGTLGGLGLVLSVIGVYGVLSYSVGKRRQEIAIRIALGAEPRSIIAMVLRQGAVLVGIGLAVGIGAALAMSKAISSLLTVSPNDPLTYLAVTFALILVALAACYLPARRTIRVDPIQALRHE
jgi:predicted permease